MIIFKLTFLVSLLNILYISGKKNLQDVLNDHKITDSMKRAIVGMTSAKLSKSEIISTIQRNLPGKQLHELNDIVVAANGVSGRPPPRDHDLRKATEQKRIFTVRENEKYMKELQRQR